MKNIDLQTRYDNPIYKNPYSEAEGMDMVDWAQELSTSFEFMTDEKRELLKEASEHWSRCGVGNLSVDLPRADHYDNNTVTMLGEPKDKELRTLGLQLNRCVYEMCNTTNKIHYKEVQAEAVGCHYYIEKRAAEVLQPIWESMDSILETGEQ